VSGIGPAACVIPRSPSILRLVYTANAIVPQDQTAQMCRPDSDVSD
jgi:hypothetical protein